MRVTQLWRAGALAVAAALAMPAAADTAQIQDLVRQGRYENALQAAERDLAVAPKDPELRFLKGLALTELGRRGEAVEVFQGLTSDYPELPEPYNNLAVIYAQQKDYDKARAALEMAIRTHPAYATAHENLGDIYSQLASQAYKKALQLDAGNAGAQTKLALVRELISAGSGNHRPRQAQDAAAPAPTPASTEPPVDAPAASSAPAPDDESLEAVKSRVLAWAKAWSDKDAEAYLSFYSPSFVVPGGRSRAAWEAERRQRVGNKPGRISVELEDLRVELDGDHARVSFRQHYNSYNFDASASKTLELVRDGDQWQIRREVVGG